jgi:hypothetical protein
LGRCAVGIGASIRQPSLKTRAGNVGGSATPVPRTALEMAATKVGLDSLEVSCSDDAQQPSACAWVMTRAEPELCESPLCIGHSLSEQHAMRSSGVGAHPAHTATLPAEMRTVNASANNRLLRVSTYPACRTERRVSNQLQSSGDFRSRRGMRIARCDGSAIGHTSTERSGSIDRCTTTDTKPGVQIASQLATVCKGTLSRAKKHRFLTG